MLRRLFKNRYNSDSKRTRFSWTFKELTFQQFRNETTSDDAAFKKLFSEIELLSCLAHDSDQKDETICDVLWKAVEGEPWAVHAQTKDVIEFLFALVVECISVSIHKYSEFKKKNRNKYPISFGDGDFEDDDSDNSEDNPDPNDDVILDKQR